MVEAKIKMTEIATGKFGIVFENVKLQDAAALVRHMNALNQETAKLMGIALRFTYSIIFVDRK